MTLSVFIARFFAVSLLVTGISHLAQPKLWRDFFLLLKRTGVAGIIIAMYTFPLGLAIIIGHNIWVLDVPVITTICGWGMMLKSVSYVLIPGQAERMIPEDERAHRKYFWGGAFIIPLSLLLIYSSFFRTIG